MVLAHGADRPIDRAIMSGFANGFSTLCGPGCRLVCFVRGRATDKLGVDERVYTAQSD